MKLFGKSLSEYIGFETGFLALILIVGLGRLGLSLVHVSNSIDKFFSLTAVLLIGAVVYPIWIWISGFGGYKHIWPVLLLQWALAQSIVVLGIVISIFSGQDNIFSAPEYSPNKVSGRTWTHVGAHVAVVVILPLVFWVTGLLIMFVTSKIKGRPNP
ncbi:MAG TPA: hypothetical protein VJX67_24915 [Blastocatellia bacterium]|nr:hypothetical protein [Blastocatellia bacterium]